MAFEVINHQETADFKLFNTARMAPVKEKYIKHALHYARHTYRTRSGPNCCNGGCASGRKKSAKKR